VTIKLRTELPASPALGGVVDRADEYERRIKRINLSKVRDRSEFCNRIPTVHGKITGGCRERRIEGSRNGVGKGNQH